MEHPSSLAERLQSSSTKIAYLTPQAFFEIGRCLAYYSEAPEFQNIARAWDDLLSFPGNEDWLRLIIIEFNRAFLTVINGGFTHQHTDSDVDEALRSSCGVYSTSPFLCSLVGSMDEFADVIEALASAYNRDISNLSQFQSLILASITNLLEHGLLLQQHVNDDDDEFLGHVLGIFQRLLCLDDDNTCLGDIIDYYAGDSRNDNVLMPKKGLLETVEKVFVDETQCEYVIQVLESCPRSSHQPFTEDRVSPFVSLSKMSSQPAIKKVEDKTKGLHNLVDQVKDIFPDLGEGYIEAALACYRGDVSRTISALIEDGDNLHPQLKLIDKKLGARKKESGTLYTVDDDKAAIDLQKERIKTMQKEEENKAFLLSTALDYNDDYDDQFDDIDDGGGASGMVGNSDGALYDVDYDAIRMYNKVALDMEKEDSFWVSKSVV